MPRSARRGKKWRRIWEVFHQAVEREASGRGAYLDEACAGDRELRRQVEKLLAAHEKGEGLLDRPLAVGLAAAEKAAPPGSEHSVEEESGATLEPGEVLADRFEIVRLIGQGGMGVVYAAFDRELQTQVALKILRPGIARDFAALERFHTEINLARRVTHPNACRIFDLFRHGDDMILLTMELLGGETLADRVRREGPLAMDQALPIIEQVAAALSAAHQVGVVHRDLKGSNVMLVAEDDAARAVVTDFGLATTPLREEGALELSRTGELLGTPAFMAPEQLTRGPVSPATDVYALGLLIYQMLTGRLPFEGDTPYEVAARRLQEEAPSPRRILPHLDSQWERAILRCLERDPKDRFQSPEEVVGALRAETVPLPPSRARRRRRRVGLAAAVAVALLAAWFILPQPWIGQRNGRRGVDLSAAEALGFQERDWVLITAFENQTGEELLDGTVEAALGRELANSRFANVVPRTRIADALQLMKRPPDSRVDLELGREVALRDGGVRALLSGRADKVGSAYLLSAELVNPADGMVVGSVSEDAGGLDGVLLAVRRLSEDVRGLLGERIADIRRSREELAKVTTPSLPALQLYTRADLVLQASQRAEGAEELLRQAIAADPGFASAYIHLAWALQRKDPAGACSEECLAHSQRAAELAGTATDRERYFILGSHFGFRQELEQAEAHYRALLEIDPDHYWGLGNLAMVLRELGREGEGVPLLQRRAEMRPNSFWDTFWASNLTFRYRSFEEAEPHLVRAARLEPGSEANRFSIAWTRSYWAHKPWLEGDIDAVLERVEEWSKPQTNAPPELRGALLGLAGRYSMAAGRLSAAEEIFRRLPDLTRHPDVPSWTERQLRLRGVELARTDPEHWKEVLVRWPIFTKWRITEEIRLYARAGLLDEARRLTGLVPEESPASPSWVGLLAEGELALAEGRPRDAIPLLREAVAGLTFFSAYGAYCHASESLARALEQTGSIPDALRVLQDASARRSQALYVGKLAWMDMQLYLARLYRELGREAEAREIEAELRRLLVYADPDFRILRQLENQSRIAQASAR